METQSIKIYNKISEEKYQMALRILEAIGIRVTPETNMDDAEMTKEEFYAKIEKSRKSKKHRMDFNQLEELILG